MVEPNNQFVNVDLDFYEVNYPSAVIAFTDKTWSEVESILQTARSHITDSISEYRISDDTGYQYVMIAFTEEISDQCELKITLSSSDLMSHFEGARHQIISKINT